MKSLLFAFFILVVFHDFSIADGGVLKTPVKIIDLDVGSPSKVQVEINGATEESQVVVFLKLSNHPGLLVASDKMGQPSLPVTSDVLPRTSYPGETGKKSRWEAVFYVPREYGDILEIYAVVCVVSNRKDWSRTREYKGFMYLPFDQTRTIDQALQLLSDFGWQPSGLTMVALNK
ncbi:hypothetical protein D3C77_186540 [compost metagenome]